jgi:hypothetical protein
VDRVDPNRGEQISAVFPPFSDRNISRRRFNEEFRSAQPVRTKLPESLWEAAVELARQHGIYAVAHPLRLDYTRRHLKSEH